MAEKNGKNIDTGEAENMEDTQKEISEKDTAPLTEKPKGQETEHVGEDEQEKDGCCRVCCSCFWRTLVLIIMIPVFLALLIVAAVVWLVTCPFKCCSPCCAPCLTALTDLLQWIACLPVRVIKWVFNIGDKEEDAEKGEVAKEASEKEDYGTSDKKHKDGEKAK